MKKRRVWNCRWEYYEGRNPELKSQVDCQSREKLYAVVYARFMGGQVQCGFGTQVVPKCLGGGWSSRDGIDPDEPVRGRLSRETLERRVKYGGRKGRSAARRLKRGWNSRK